MSLEEDLKHQKGTIAWMTSGFQRCKFHAENPALVSQMLIAEIRFFLTIESG